MSETGNRECAKCKKSLPLAEFQPLSSGKGYYKKCKGCSTAGAEKKEGGKTPLQTRFEALKEAYDSHLSSGKGKEEVYLTLGEFLAELARSS